MKALFWCIFGLLIFCKMWGWSAATDNEKWTWRSWVWLMLVLVFLGSGVLGWWVA